jgi:hypothetical protein
MLLFLYFSLCILQLCYNYSGALSWGPGMMVRAYLITGTQQAGVLNERLSYRLRIAF